MGNPTNISSSWMTADKDVIHPDAPAGGGGMGVFRTPGTAGVGEPLTGALPSPEAPTARNLIPPDPINASNEVVLPPPVTKPSTTSLKKQKDMTNDIDVMIEVLADVDDKKVTGEAETKPSVDTLTTTFPEVETTDTPGGGAKVTKILTPFILKGKITIQIRYKPGTDKTARSAYGRGTTMDDKKNGNVTIGFHESCHLNDHLTWMKANPLPVFSIRVGITAKEYQKACDDFSAAIDKYVEDSDKNTAKLTDETGDPTRSKYLAANP